MLCTLPAGWRTHACVVYVPYSSVTAPASTRNSSPSVWQCGPIVVPGIDTIDGFLESLAADLGKRAIAIVLSGTGSDGAAGAMRVKQHGGLVFAQDPTTAEHDGMPQAAIWTGAVDHVLPAEQIAQAILQCIPAMLRPRVGIADGKFPARVAAGRAAPGGFRKITPSVTKETLAAEPVASLPMPVEMIRRLEQLGLATLGLLAELPPSAVAARFGPEGRRAWELANGNDPSPVTPRAEQEVRGTLLLEAIAAKEGLQATDADVDAKVESLAQEAGAQAAAVRRAYGNADQRQSLSLRLREEKTIEFLKSRAKY